MPNTNVDVVKRFVLGEGADQRSHLRMAHEKMIARRVDTPTAGERRVDGSFDVVDPEVTIRIPDSMPYGGVHVGPEGFAAVAKAMHPTMRCRPGVASTMRQIAKGGRSFHTATA